MITSAALKWKDASFKERSFLFLGDFHCCFRSCEPFLSEVSLLVPFSEFHCILESDFGYFPAVSVGVMIFLWL